MIFYRSILTGRIVAESSLNIIEAVYGHDELEHLINTDNVLTEIEPTVIDCIRDGSKTTAMLRYREIHNCGVRDAKNGVETLMKDMARFRKEKK